MAGCAIFPIAYNFLTIKKKITHKGNKKKKIRESPDTDCSLDFNMRCLPPCTED